MKTQNNKNIENLEEMTKGYFNVPIEGNIEANEVWNVLFTKNIKELKKNAHSLFLVGIRKLKINKKLIPKVSELEKIVKKKTGWKLTPTDTEYSNSEDWFLNLSNKSFLVTKFIRSKSNLEYTPFPDAFHDIFGHLPFVCSKRFMKIAHKLGLIYQNLKTKDQKEKLANFWWYTAEFGLIKENGKLKAFGAGLMSSIGERHNAFSENVELRPFNIEEIKNTQASPHDFHKKLFVLENIKQLEDAVDGWLV